MSELTTAARPYAKAVYEIARDSQSYDVWSDRLQFLAAAVADPALAKLLDKPKMTHAARAEMLRQVASDYLDENGSNFVNLLAENNRLELLPAIQALFEEYRSEAEGSVEADVVSATELTEEQAQKIADSLSRRMNRKVRIKSSVDPDLIAGAIIRAGDLVIDGSVRGKLQGLKQNIAG
ncbi:F0F1 ATP synthase subunit delta [Granulosicoccaceae sp. 1_MG-2023]|nr:F0F1 ATP synthase subunit delta [Granulosicoccaceae sp. 1_MG-2023]